MASSVPALLAHWAECSPGAVALRFKQHGLWHERSYRALAAEVQQLAAALAGLGLGAGGALGVYGKSAPQLLTAALAALRLGARVVTLEHGAQPARLREVLLASEVKAVLLQGRTELEALLTAAELAGTDAVGRPLAVVEQRDALPELGIASLSGWLERAAPPAPLAVLSGAFVAYSADARTPARQLTHAALLAVPAAARHAARTDLFLLDDVLGDTLRELGLGLWLGAGAALNLPEVHGDVLRDLREIGPSQLVASELRLSQLQRAVEARYPAPGSWRRLWIERALSTRVRRSPSELLDALLVARPLRRQLGASRLHSVWVLDVERARNAASIWSGLGAELCDGRRAPGMPPEHDVAQLAGVSVEEQSA